MTLPGCFLRLYGLHSVLTRQERVQWEGLMGFAIDLYFLSSICCVHFCNSAALGQMKTLESIIGPGWKKEQHNLGSEMCTFRPCLRWTCSLTADLKHVRWVWAVRLQGDRLQGKTRKGKNALRDKRKRKNSLSSKALNNTAFSWQHCFLAKVCIKSLHPLSNLPKYSTLCCVNVIHYVVVLKIHEVTQTQKYSFKRISHRNYILPDASLHHLVYKFHLPYRLHT